jgi:hypothetical protein
VTPAAGYFAMRRRLRWRGNEVTESAKSVEGWARRYDAGKVDVVEVIETDTGVAEPAGLNGA